MIILIIADISRYKFNELIVIIIFRIFKFTGYNRNNLPFFFFVDNYPFLEIQMIILQFSKV